jgi:hypothetical protein
MHIEEKGRNHLIDDTIVSMPLTRTRPAADIAPICHRSVVWSVMAPNTGMVIDPKNPDTMAMLLRREEGRKPFT